MTVFFIILICAVAADQVTKYLITANFSLYESAAIIPNFFNLVYVTNKGAAFSLFASVESPVRHYFFVTLNSVAVLVLVVLAYRLRTKTILYRFSFGLIAAGALGNLIDRLRFGAVVDFLDFYYGTYHWPAFNVADSSIFMGVALLVLINILESKKS